MERLVVVSNRIALPDTSKNSAGGLAVGLLDALEEHGGLWFGWNGEINQLSSEEQPLQVEEQKNITYASCAFNQNDYDLYYSQFSNTVIWPAFHYRLDLVTYQREAWQGYLRVNQQLANKLLPLLRAQDVIWAHDYHLLPFAAALRQAGAKQRLGFFLHIPFPVPEIFMALPDYQQLLRLMTYYDLLGFQTESDAAAFIAALQRETELTLQADGSYQAFGNTFHVAAYPIGIEPDSIRKMAEGPLPAKMQAIRRELGDAKNIIACERLDYSKGIPDRFLAYEHFLEHYPQQRGKIRYTQIAPTSRGEVQAYQTIRHQLETEAGRINSQYGTMSWTPLYYLNQHFDRRLLMKIFRLTDIALITPLRDGMNLVAKEYLAAQDPTNPGVLILSKFAGAACELKQALLVNPYDRHDVAQAISHAVHMPKQERVERHARMMEILTQQTTTRWRETFLTDLYQIGAQSVK